MEDKYCYVEETHIEIFYKNFSRKHQATSIPEIKLFADFLKGNIKIIFLQIFLNHAFFNSVLSRF